MPTIVYFESPADPATVVYHIDLLLLALFGLVILLRLPRSAARFWRWSEWTPGHILYYSDLPQTSRQVDSDGGSDSDGSSGNRDSATNDSPSSSIQRLSEKRASSSYPPHASSCPRYLRGIAQIFQARLNPGFSTLKATIVVIYLAILLYPALYESNPFYDPLRYGWIAVSQLPFVFALGTKNNVLGWFLDVGYEKLQYLHRMSGRVFVVAANIHGVGIIHTWALEGTFRANIVIPIYSWGLTALVCADALWFFSTNWWRTKAYQLFLMTHIVSLTVILPAISNHMPQARPYIFASVALFAFDIVMGWLKTKITTATIRPLPELSMTRVEIPEINSGWRAGQHVRLGVISLGMGLLGWSEAHPFTIASVTKSEEGVILLCKKAGDWTNKLYDLAKASTENNQARQVKVWIDGPYGGPGHRMFHSFSAAVFVAGGSGISFALSAVQELIQKDLEGNSSVKVIHLVWSVQDAASLVPMLSLLTSLVEQSVFTPIRISIFYTRTQPGKFPFPDDFFRSRTTVLKLEPGRPKVSKILEIAVCEAISLGSRPKGSDKRTGVIVGVCGPVSLADTVTDEVGKIDPKKRDQVGGIEIHEETFGW